MGFFSDIRIASELSNAAAQINDCVENGLMPHVKGYNNGEPFSKQDRPYIDACVRFISQKTDFMHQRMQELSPNKLMTTKVRCLDGHYTGVFGYVMSMKEMCNQLSIQLSKSY